MQIDNKQKPRAYSRLLGQPGKRIDDAKIVMDDLHAICCMNTPVTGPATLPDGSIDPIKLAVMVGMQKVVQHIEEQIRRADFSTNE